MNAPDPVNSTRASFANAGAGSPLAKLSNVTLFVYGGDDIVSNSLKSATPGWEGEVRACASGAGRAGGSAGTSSGRAIRRGPTRRRRAALGAQRTSHPFCHQNFCRRSSRCCSR
jgi:hypothetical protein